MSIDLREAMSRFPTGVVIVTTGNAPDPYGTAVSAVASVSLDPALVLVSLARDSVLLGRLAVGQAVGLNVLAADQHDLVRRFSGPRELRFVGVDWRQDHAPRLPGAHAWIAGDVDHLIEAGDHVLVIVAVRAASTGRGEPLVYHHRRFGTQVPIADPAA